jgi:hypothetical protein
MVHIRLPDSSEIDEMLKGVSNRSEMGERKLKKAIANAVLSIPTATKTQLLADLRMTDGDLQNLLQRQRLNDADRKQLKDVIDKLRVLDKQGLTIYTTSGDDTRPLSPNEKKAMEVLVPAVAKMMNEIAGGMHDTYVENVFGAASAKQAKTVFSKAAKALVRLHKKDKIVADVLRKSAVWSCGGLTNKKGMALAEHAVTGLAAGQSPLPSDTAFLTLVHESTHAVPPDEGGTTDIVYENHENFLSAQAQVKVKTADYYKVVVRFIAERGGKVFIPQDAATHAHRAGRSVPLQQAVTDANKLVNGAWVSAIRIHDHLRRIAQTPDASGWETWAQNVSRLMGLTLHREQKLQFSSGKTHSKVLAVDLSTLDNKIALLAAMNGGGNFVVAEPPARPQSEYVDYVIEEVLKMVLNRGSHVRAKFSKDYEKDVAVIKSLGSLHESVSGQSADSGFNSLKKDLPAPMKAYLRKYGKLA